MHSPDRYRFTLTKRQANDLEDNLVLDAARFVHLGIEQPDGTFQFDLSHEDLEDLAESLAAACNHTEDEQTQVRLDTIYRKLDRMLNVSATFFL